MLIADTALNHNIEAQSWSPGYCEVMSNASIQQTPAEYYASLPAAVAAAGVLFFNADGHVLTVQPTYKDDWEIPGGTIEAGEYPLDVAVREVKEELGIAPAIERLLGVDWVPPADPRPALITYIFDGGMLSPEDVEAIQLNPVELRAYRFLPPEQIHNVLLERLAQRVNSCITARENGTTSYLHTGQHQR